VSELIIFIHFFYLFWAYIQPAIYVASLAAVEVLRAQEKGQDIIDSVDVTCGLSLGEYTALAFAGAFRCVLPSILP
jgi:malonyl CoA-acyl carrier protein transacylase